MHLARPLTLSRAAAPAAARRSDPPSPARRRCARERNQRANVSQDAALYSCACGYVFKAAVTTSVGCPHCGTDQAW